MKGKLITMLKAPRRGMVKTRLARTLGPDRALAAYRQLMGRLLTNLAEVKGVELRFTPDEAASEIAEWARSDWVLAPQGEGDLGARLERAFREAFHSDYPRVVIIGSDCPWVTRDDIERAWEVLSDYDLVIGPSPDGGYWLVGLSRNVPELFEGISWSTEAVLSQTLEKADRLGLAYKLLRELSDVDTVEQWRAWT